ncbi:MAG: hypothetical protein ABFR65_02080 [Pseudomonadota bacterium]
MATKFQAYAADRLNQFPQLVNIPDDLRREIELEEKVFILRFLQTEHSDWLLRPFYTLSAKSRYSLKESVGAVSLVPVALVLHQGSIDELSESGSGWPQGAPRR